MNAMRRKIIASIVLFTLIATVIIGGSSLFYMKGQFSQNTIDYLAQSAQLYGSDIDTVITGAESMVDTLAKSVAGVIDPSKINDSVYYYSLSQTLDDMALQFHDNRFNIMSVYVRFDPDLSYSTAGFFHADINGDGILQRQLPTDLSVYSPDDIEHVGWFYETLRADQPIWMNPYYNANIGIDMISYVAPLRVNDRAIGVVGVDINFETFKDIVARSPKAGKAVLLNESFAFMIHDEFSLNDRISEIDDGKLAYVEERMKAEGHGILRYTLSGVDKIMGFTRLSNGWYMVVTLTEDEAFLQVNRAFKALVLIISLITLVLLGLSYSLGGFIDHLVNQNSELENLVYIRTAELNQSNLELKDTMLELESNQEELIALNNELKDSYNQLKNAQDQLIIAEKLASLGELVAGVAHEINTPLGIGLTLNSFLNDSIVQVNDRFVSGKLGKADLNEYLHSSLEASELAIRNLMRAAEIVDTFKQVAVDQSTLELRKVNLRDYIGKIIKNLTPRSSKEKHTFHIHCEDSIEVYTYPGAIAQIITNLFVNALTHGFKVDQSGAIDIRLEKEHNMLHIIFQDNGNGISEDNLSKIFNPFFSTNKPNGSSGLGLHITYNLVTQTLGGTISVNSTPGQGTRFDILFPVIDKIV